MYIPKAFEIGERAEMTAFMRRHSFATIITCIDGRPVATPLPVLVEERDGQVWLTAHFAVGNEQAKAIEGQTSLVIFAEPHAYISPRNYEKQESVPTWNYLAVHAYGQTKVIHEEEHKMQMMEKMIRFYEQDYLAQWQGLSEKYKMGMLRGIVAFELEVTELQGKAKLSQNRSVGERERIIQHLENSNDGLETELAQYMQQVLDQKWKGEGR